MLLDDLAGDLLDQFFIVGHKPKKKSQMSRSGPPWSDHPPASLSGTKGLPIEERKVILIIGLEGLAYERLPRFSMAPSARCVLGYREGASSYAGGGMEENGPTGRWAGTSKNGFYRAERRAA